MGEKHGIADSKKGKRIKLFDRLKKEGTIIYNNANKGLFYIIVKKLENQLPENMKLVGEYVYNGYLGSFPERMRWYNVVMKEKENPIIIGSIQYDEIRKLVLIELDDEWR